ncbi:sugar phosphate isomerase/epimerase family protein [Saccharopolyspora phatthalungensis]|uniref:Sugar phosphate isomerase/epimerase n=1 Tax=Saccharopolyspora phatthalungensis TaxID=664693 RepID=A0A840QGI7_9PSEU|nr:sugar phosphate isomerase/epimerase [Saccharopolyspora phatthalungensis]MBB5159227.1 sugar phosphate isomerase/epimerase [Saccharopolyspora phatthalungensis]
MPLQVFQSRWAMIGLPRHASGPWSPTEQLDQIAGAGFDGVSISFHDPENAVLLSREAVERGLGIEVVCYPADAAEFDALLRVLEPVPGVSHITMQPMLRTPHIDVAAKAIRQWYASARQAGTPLLIETHRGRLTSDILFTTELLDAVPELRLTADLSHYVNGDEFALPVSERNQALIERLLARSDVFHGRIASPGQVQVPVRAEHTRPLLELFTSWWRRGFELRRAEDPEPLVTFTAELGPPGDWYAGLGPDGNEHTDRWVEALDLANLARSLWA